MEDFSEIILNFRAKWNLSLEKCAKAFNVTLQTVHNIESGYCNPTKLTQRKILLGIENYEKNRR